MQHLLKLHCRLESLSVLQEGKQPSQTVSYFWLLFWPSHDCLWDNWFAHYKHPQDPPPQQWIVSSNCHYHCWNWTKLKKQSLQCWMQWKYEVLLSFFIDAFMLCWAKKAFISYQLLVNLIKSKYSAHFLSCCSFMCFMTLLVLNDVKIFLVDQIPCFLDDEPRNAAIPNGFTTSSVTAFSTKWCTKIAQCCSDLIVRILSGH